MKLNGSTMITPREEDEESVTLTSTSSDDPLFQFDQHLSSSSSSDLNLSIACRSSNRTNSTLSLTEADDESVALTEQRSSSDQESVLYTRLAKELHVIEATLDSDFERCGGNLF